MVLLKIVFRCITKTQCNVQHTQYAKFPSPALQKDYTMGLLELYLSAWTYTYIYTQREDIQLGAPKKLYKDD